MKGPEFFTAASTVCEILAANLFRREGGDDLLEARIAAQRVPEGRQLKHSVARDYGCPVCRCCGGQLLQRQILLAGPGRDKSEVGHDRLPIDRIFLHR